MQAAGAATGGAKTGADTVKEAGGRFAAFLDVAGKVVVATGKGLITGLPLGPPGAVIAGIQAGVSEASKHSEAFQKALFDQMIADSDSSDEEEFVDESGNVSRSRSIDVSGLKTATPAMAKASHGSFVLRTLVQYNVIPGKGGTCDYGLSASLPFDK